MTVISISDLALFARGDYVSLGKQTFICAGVNELGIRIVPNTFFNRMRYVWPVLIRRKLRLAWWITKGFIREHFLPARCYVCRRNPAEEPGQLCYLCYEIQHEVDAEMASYGMDE